MLIVDSHVHVLPPDPHGGDAIRDPYEIWEYGAKEGMAVLDTAGTIDEVTAAMTSADCDHFVVVNMFLAEHEASKDPRSRSRLLTSP